MALRTTFEQIVNMTSDESKLSSATSRGTDHREHIRAVVRRWYQILGEAHEWQHLKIKRSDAGKVIAAGSRYYDFPANLNIDQPFTVWVKSGGSWDEIPFGISPAEYSVHDSDEDVRADPIQRWDWYGGGGESAQFEVWPMPATNDTEPSYGSIRFEGKKILTPLTSNAARADIDDIVLSLFSAGTLFAETGKDKAALEKFEAGNTRIGTLTGARASGVRVAFGRGVIDDGSSRPRHPTFIRGS